MSYFQNVIGNFQKHSQFFFSRNFPKSCFGNFGYAKERICQIALSKCRDKRAFVFFLDSYTLAAGLVKTNLWTFEDKK